MIMKCNMIIRVTWSFHVFSWHVSTHLLRKAASGFAVAKAAPAIAPLVRPRAAPEAAPPAAPASCGECGLQHHGRDPPTGFSCQRWDDVPSVQCSVVWMQCLWLQVFKCFHDYRVSILSFQFISAHCSQVKAKPVVPAPPKAAPLPAPATAPVTAPTRAPAMMSWPCCKGAQAQPTQTDISPSEQHTVLNYWWSVNVSASFSCNCACSWERIQP